MLLPTRESAVRFAGETRFHKAAALLALAIAAMFTSLIYWFFFTRSYNLLDLYMVPGYTLQRRSQSDSGARWWLALAFLIQGGLYWAGWRLTRWVHGRAAWAIVLGGGLLSAAALLLMYPFGAADIFDYAMHGRILALHGGNPYYDAAQRYSQDPLFAYVGWKNYPTTYGPLWVLLSATVARLAGDGVAANVLAFKLLSGGCAAIGTALVADTLRRMAPERALQGVLLFAWNPVILYETFGNGHNDMAMLVWVLAAVALLARRQYALAVLGLVAGALVKFIPLLLLPAAVLIALRDLPGMWARLRFALLAGLGALALAALAYAPFWRDASVLTVFKRSDLYTTSLPAFLRAWLGARFGAARVAHVLGAGSAALAGALALWQALLALRDRSWTSFSRAGFRILLLYLLFACLWFQEWYSMWPVALAVFLPMGWEVGLAVLFNYAALTKPLVFGPLLLWRIPRPPSAWIDLRLGPSVMGAAWLALLLWLAAHFRRRPSLARETIAPVAEEF